MKHVSGLSTRVASAGLLGIAGLHVIWATGSSWPLADAGELADVVAERFRRRDRTVYSPVCLTLAALASPAVRSAAQRPPS